MRLSNSILAAAATAIAVIGLALPAGATPGPTNEIDPSGASTSGVVAPPQGGDSGACTYTDPKGNKKHGYYSPGGSWCCWINSDGWKACGNCDPLVDKPSNCRDGHNVMTGGTVGDEAIAEGLG